MKHLKKFNENFDEESFIENMPNKKDDYFGDEMYEAPKKKISFEEAKNWILENYDDDRVIQMFDEQIHEYVDREQMDDEGYDSEYDYYVDYGRGEAESDVVMDIVSDLKNNFDLDFSPMGEEDDNNLYSFIRNVFSCLSY